MALTLCSKGYSVLAARSVTPVTDGRVERGGLEMLCLFRDLLVRAGVTAPRRLLQLLTRLLAGRGPTLLLVGLRALTVVVSARV